MFDSLLKRVYGRWRRVREWKRDLLTAKMLEGTS